MPRQPAVSFKELVSAPAEKLLKIVLPLADDYHDLPQADRIRRFGERCGLRRRQVICALGFNPSIRDLPEVLAVVGFDDFRTLEQERNGFFSTDIYEELSVNDMIAIYGAVTKDRDNHAVMQYLLESRLDTIENEIDASVNSIVIERYRKEVRAMYLEGAAQIDFAEKRLNRMESGFRALVNEVSIIVESKLIPVGDIFFRDTILPEEKRKLMVRGMIPESLIAARLEDQTMSDSERQMLEEYVRLNPPRKTRPQPQDDPSD